jgi:NodT family efflux transporter outer membrane factor (OMF) lipoprotein
MNERPIRRVMKGGARWLALCLTLSACAVGPDFQPPSAPTVAGFDVSPLPPAEQAAEPGPALVTAPDLPARWWDLFQYPELETTLRQVVAGSNTLGAARQSLAQAQQAVISARAPLFPQVTAEGTAARSGAGLALPRGSGSAASSYGLGATVSETLDVFGLTRRSVEQQEALVDNQRYQLAEAYLTLTGGAVTEAIAIAAARLEIATTLDLIDSDQRNLDLVQRKFEIGKAARSDVLTAESQLLGDRTQLAGQRQQLSVARHALAVLAGQTPAEWVPPDFDLEAFHLPAEIPLTVPSALIRQRPDILAAEAQLHAASAAIGVATAQLYPALTLSASLTQQGRSLDTLFQGAGSLWSLGGGVTAPLFNAGALAAQKQAAVDAFEAQYATYRQTVIVAFGQVADALRALEHDADTLAAAGQSLEVARESLALQRASYGVGKSSVLDLIAVQRSYSQARLSYAAARIQRDQDIVQYFVVLGGGWRGVAEGLER